MYVFCRLSCDMFLYRFTYWRLSFNVNMPLPPFLASSYTDLSVRASVSPKLFFHSLWHPSLCLVLHGSVCRKYGLKIILLCMRMYCWFDQIFNLWTVHLKLYCPKSKQVTSITVIFYCTGGFNQIVLLGQCVKGANP